VPLSETTLLKVAGDLVYARGEDYVRYVRGLRTTASKAYASIQAKNVYTVELDWSGPLPDGSCTCPHNADGNFCKHLVATGLAAIDTGRVAVDDTASGTAEGALEAAVQAMDVDELRELVMTLAERDDGVRRLRRFAPRRQPVTTRTPKPSWRPMYETRWRSAALSTTDVPMRSQEWPMRCSTNSRTTSTVGPPKPCGRRCCAH
jgi:hypothetical protein